MRTVKHGQNLVWIAKSPSTGDVILRAIGGDPVQWVQNASYAQIGGLRFTNPGIRNISHFLALAFDYASHDTFVGDRGLKTVLRINIPVSAARTHFGVNNMVGIITT